MNQLSAQKQDIFFAEQLSGGSNRSFARQHGTEAAFSLSAGTKFLSADTASTNDYARASAAPVVTLKLSSQLAPVRAVLKLQAFWALTDEQLMRMCGLPLEDVDAPVQSLSKHFRLADVRTRLRSIIAIRGRLSALFGGDARRERQWLETPWARIDARSPIALLTSTDINDIFEVEAQVRELAGG